MKTLFNSNESAAKILSHSAMKQVLGGFDEDKSPDDGGKGRCKVHCSDWSDGKEGSVADCLTDASRYCGGSGFDYCSCD